jgi:hypothetical protein
MAYIPKMGTMFDANMSKHTSHYNKSLRRWVWTSFIATSFLQT